MPGELKPDAVCPKCGDPLLAIVDESSIEQITREYFHGKTSPKARRRRRCVVIFYDHVAAVNERRKLEKPYVRRRRRR
jgi:hypothetical protein